MTIGGLVYGPTLGAPSISPWSNVSVGFGGPTFTSQIFPFGAINQVLYAADYWQRAYTAPTVGIGNLADAPGSEPLPPAPYTESEEVCWVDTGSGTVACFPSDSIFQPGGIWGPLGNWIPESEYHPPPINPEYLPERRVEEAEESEVAVDWGAVFSGAIDIAQGQYVGGLTQLAQPAAQLLAPSGNQLPPAVVNGAAMATYSGSCPPRKTRTLTIDCATGQEVKRTRRRRRRLLTSSDLGDLAQLQALVGKGSNAMSVAVSKAIR